MFYQNCDFCFWNHIHACPYDKTALCESFLPPNAEQYQNYLKLEEIDAQAEYDKYKESLEVM